MANERTDPGKGRPAIAANILYRILSLRGRTLRKVVMLLIFNDLSISDNRDLGTVNTV